MRRLTTVTLAASLAILAVSTSACGDNTRESADAAPAPPPALPTPTPLTGAISPCDLLLPVEIGHHLQMDVAEPSEDRATRGCEYDGALRAQVTPATDSPGADLDLALLGMGPAEQIDLAGQPAAAASDSSGVTSLAVSLPSRHQTLTLTAWNFADGRVPGTDELAVPGDDRVMVAQEEALRALAEIALTRLGVTDAR